MPAVCLKGPEAAAILNGVEDVWMDGGGGGRVGTICIHFSQKRKLCPYSFQFHTVYRMVPPSEPEGGKNSQPCSEYALPQMFVIIEAEAN
jgi:hypothetical protein